MPNDVSKLAYAILCVKFGIAINVFFLKLQKYHYTYILNEIINALMKIFIGTLKEIMNAFMVSVYFYNSN